MNGHNRIHVTQAGSAMIFLFALIVVAKDYSPQDYGIGYFSAEYLKKANDKWGPETSAIFRYIVLFACVLLNCLRYYLNVWAIETNKLLQNRILTNNWRSIDEVLRFISLFFVYFVMFQLQHSIASNTSAPISIELCMVCVFSCFVVWDYCTLRRIEKVAYPPSANSENEEQLRERCITFIKRYFLGMWPLPASGRSPERKNLMKRIIMWLKLDLCCLAGSFLWTGLAFAISREMISPHPMLIGMAIFIPAFIYLLVFIIDVAFSYKEYWDLYSQNKLIAWCGVVGLLYFAFTAIKTS